MMLWQSVQTENGVPYHLAHRKWCYKWANRCWSYDNRGKQLPISNLEKIEQLIFCFPRWSWSCLTTACNLCECFQLQVGAPFLLCTALWGKERPSTLRSKPQQQLELFPNEECPVNVGSANLHGRLVRLCSPSVMLQYHISTQSEE